MNSEQLLKAISELIKKNEAFFASNPELFLAVQDRLIKAIDYEDFDPENNEDPEDFYNKGYEDNSAISDLFDDLPEEDVDEDGDGVLSEEESDDWLKENDPEYDNYKDTDGDGDIDNNDIREVTGIGSDIDGDGDIDIPETKRQDIKQKDTETDKNKISASGYKSWEPKDKYEPHHDAAIKKFTSEGWSPREAERLAGAHSSPSNFHDALRSKTKPSQPSDKMLAHMKGHAGDWLRNAERKISESADAKKNPIKHASAKVLTAHEDAMGDFKTAYSTFLNSKDVKDLRGRDRHQAIQAFKGKWGSENPTHRENVIASADAGKSLGEAMDQRRQHLEQGKEDIMNVGKLNPEGISSSAGEFSTAASGDLNDLTSQGAAQAAGGTQDEESGYSTGTVKDPSMLFAQKNPEYVKSLHAKLASKLNPEQSSRLQTVNSVKKGTNVK